MPDAATDTTESLNLMATTSHRALLGRMTPQERAAGRFMRAPDHGDDGAGGGDPDGADADKGADDQDQGGADGDADKGADAGDQDSKVNDKDAGDKSLMGKAGGKKDGEADGGKPDLPEKYELTPPEGFAIDDALLGEVDPVFRELGLNNEQANKLMPLAGKFAERIAAAQNDAHQAMATDWAKQAKADKEIGGANWAETETLVAKALDQFGAPEGSDFRKLLDDSKLGNHPEMIRMFRKIGAQLGEGAVFARGDAGAPVKLPREAVMYPDDVPKEGVN